MRSGHTASVAQGTSIHWCVLQDVRDSFVASAVFPVVGYSGEIT